MELSDWKVSWREGGGGVWEGAWGACWRDGECGHSWEAVESTEGQILSRVEEVFSMTADRMGMYASWRG